MKRSYNEGGAGYGAGNSINMGGPSAGDRTLANAQLTGHGKRVKGFKQDWGNPAAEIRGAEPWKPGYQSREKLPGGSMLSSQGDIFQMMTRMNPLQAEAIETTRMTNPYIRHHHIVDDDGISSPLDMLSRESVLFMLDPTKGGGASLKEASQALSKKHTMFLKSNRSFIQRTQHLFSWVRSNFILAKESVMRGVPADGMPGPSLATLLAPLSFAFVSTNDAGHDLRQRHLPPMSEGRTTNGIYAGPANVKSMWPSGLHPGQKLFIIPRLVPGAGGDGSTSFGLDSQKETQTPVTGLTAGKKVAALTPWATNNLSGSRRERMRRLPPLDLVESVDDNGWVQPTLVLELGAYYGTRHQKHGISSGPQTIRNEFYTFADSPNIRVILRPRWIAV